MIEQNTVARKNIVRFTVVYSNPVGIQLGYGQLYWFTL